jgi:hypothetical protein
MRGSDYGLGVTDALGHTRAPADFSISPIPHGQLQRETLSTVRPARSRPFARDHVGTLARSETAHSVADGAGQIKYHAALDDSLENRTPMCSLGERAVSFLP